MKLLLFICLVLFGLFAGLHTACDHNVFKLVWITGMLPLPIDLHLASNAYWLVLGVMLTAVVCSRIEAVRSIAIAGSISMTLQLLIFSGFPTPTVNHICKAAVWL